MAMASGNEPITLALMLTQLTAAQTAPSLPSNPERPMNFTTCEEALDRVQEAADGSPLVSPEENKAILQEAIRKARQICLAKPPQ
jgi:hypothetical protein